MDTLQNRNKLSSTAVCVAVGVHSKEITKIPRTVNTWPLHIRENGCATLPRASFYEKQWMLSSETYTNISKLEIISN